MPNEAKAGSRAERRRLAPTEDTQQSPTVSGGREWRALTSIAGVLKLFTAITLSFGGLVNADGVREVKSNQGFSRFDH